MIRLTPHLPDKLLLAPILIGRSVIPAFPNT